MFSTKWNKDIREKQSQRANNAYNKIKNAKVTYVIPSLFPDEPAWSVSRPPNRSVTEFVAAERDARLGSAVGVVEKRAITVRLGRWIQQYWPKIPSPLNT